MDRLEKHVGDLSEQLRTLELSRLLEKSKREQDKDDMQARYWAEQAEFEEGFMVYDC